MPVRSSRTALCTEETRGPKVRAGDIAAPILSTEALDDRIAIVGTAGSGKTYAFDAGDLAKALGKKPTGGHWNSGIAILRNNGLIETEPAVATPGSKRYRAAALFRN